MTPWWQRYKYIILGLTLSLYWTAGFYPFQWEAPVQVIDNGFTTAGSHELVFDQPGIACTKTAPGWIETATSLSSLKVDLFVRSARSKQYGPARILTLSRDTHLRNLTIGQEGLNLIVRLRTLDTNQNGFPPYLIKGVFSTPGWHRIIMNIVPGKMNILVDDKIVQSTLLPEKALSNWSPTYRLALGNEFTYDRPWLGQIRRVNIATGEWDLDYTRESNLYAPKHLSILKANFSPVPFIGKTISPAFLSDFFVNLLGFIPLGILLMAISEQRLSVFSVMALSAVLSLSIELGQLFLAGRVTETEDFILNTLGGLIGALLYKKYTGKHHATPS